MSAQPEICDIPVRGLKSVFQVVLHEIIHVKVNRNKSSLWGVCDPWTSSRWTKTYVWQVLNERSWRRMENKPIEAWWKRSGVSETCVRRVGPLVEGSDLPVTSCPRVKSQGYWDFPRRIIRLRIMLGTSYVLHKGYLLFPDCSWVRGGFSEVILIYRLVCCGGGVFILGDHLILTSPNMRKC